MKNISIKEYLARLGVNPKTERAGAGMYLSPIRSERTPSFRVDYNKNLWYDFGIGEGGSIIDLVMRMERCDFRAAVAILRGSGIDSTWVAPHALPPAPSPSPLEIVGVGELTNPALLSYLASRGIDTETAKYYCKQVNYTIRQKPYYAIGFANNDGGWELRNKFFKGGSSPKAPTFIDNGSDECLVFEGFMDMLSYLKIIGSKGSEKSIMVLNSVGNLKRAMPLLALHKSLLLMLDNDAAGRNAVDTLRTMDTHVRDLSDFYLGFKDVNEMILSPSLSHIKA